MGKHSLLHLGVVVHAPLSPRCLLAKHRQERPGWGLAGGGGWGGILVEAALDPFPLPDWEGWQGREPAHPHLASVTPRVRVCISPALSSTRPRRTRSLLALLLPPGVPDSLLALPEHLHLFIPKMQLSISALARQASPPQHPPVIFLLPMSLGSINHSTNCPLTLARKVGLTPWLFPLLSPACNPSPNPARSSFPSLWAWSVEEHCLQWPHTDRHPLARLSAHPSSSASQILFVPLQRFTVWW